MPSSSVRKKEKDQKIYKYDSYDLNTKQGKRVFYERRRKDEAKMRRLKYFNKEYDKEEFEKYGELSNVEKEVWNFDINLWADDYVRQYLGAFMPLLYNTLCAYMKEISD
jgi:hypothetical protein